MKIVRRPRKPEPHVSGRYVPLIGGDGYFIAVDPGLNGTGWAVFRRGKDFTLAVSPVASGSISVPRRDLEWTRRAEEIIDELLHVSKEWRVSVVYVEQPQFMEGSGKGMVAARDGDLVKLSILTGMILGHFRALCRTHSTAVPVREWKGSMPKDVCHKRVMSKLKGWRPATDESHELDAVGIGLFAKGVI